MVIDAATLRRYLHALKLMLDDAAEENRRFARQCWRDISEPGVAGHDYLAYLWELPLAALRGPERRLRLLADRSPLAGVTPVSPPSVRLEDGVIVTC